MLLPQQNPFWDYSLAHYARPEVAECCLDYQERLGANVNLLLFCCWLGCSGVLLSAESLKKAESQISSWDTQAVQPLRKVRRFVSSLITGGDSEVTSVVSEVVPELDNRLRQVELMAERVVQEALYSWWQQQDNYLRYGVPPSGIEASGIKRQRRNLNNYLAFFGENKITDGSPLLWPLGSTLATD